MSIIDLLPFDKRTIHIPGINYYPLVSSYIENNEIDTKVTGLLYYFSKNDYTFPALEFWNHHYNMGLKITNTVGLNHSFWQPIKPCNILPQHLARNRKRYYDQVNIVNLQNLYHEYDYISTAYFDWMFAILKYETFENIPMILEKRSIPLYTSDVISARTLFEPFYRGPLKTCADICNEYLKYKLEERTWLMLSGE